MSTALAVRPFKETQQIADAFAKSGYFRDATDVAKAIVKVMAGEELGLGPLQAMTGIHVIQGKPAIGAAILGGLVKRHPRYDYQVVTLTDDECELEFFQDGKSVGKSTFTMADARKAGVTGKDTWKNYPRNMLFARALSNGVRWYCPDVTMTTVYTPEELGAEVNEEGDVIDVTPVEKPAPSVNGAKPEPRKTAPAKPETAVAPEDAPEHWTPLIEACTTLEECGELWATKLSPWIQTGGDNGPHRKNTAAKFWSRVGTIAKALIPDMHREELPSLLDDPLLQSAPPTVRTRLEQLVAEAVLELEKVA